jgi:hypothetical protein
MQFARGGALAAVIAGSIVASAAATPLTPTSPGGLGVRLLAPPGGGFASPLSHTYIVDALAPGKRIRRRIEVMNSTRQSMRVAVYPAAASLRRGLFTFAGGHLRNDLAGWTRVDVPLLILRPGASTVVALTIDVPTTAAPGEHHAVVWAELAATVNNRVRLVNRVGIRLYVTVGRGGDAPANFAIGRLRSGRSGAGDPFLAATVVNSGARTLLLGGDLTLSKGPGGSTAGPFPAALDVALSPGGSAEMRVRLDRRLPRGPWLARLRLRSGQLERRVVATVLFPREGRVPVVAAGAPSDSRRRSLLLLAFFTLAVGVVATLGRRLSGGRLARSGPRRSAVKHS